MYNPVKAYRPADNPDWALETDLRWTHDLDGRLISISAAAAQALGFKREDLLKIPVRDLIAAEYRAHFQSYLDTIRKHGAAKGLLAVQTSGGKRRVWEYWNLLHEGAGASIIVGAARDVTELVQTERVLRASEVRFSTAFYSSPVAMAITTLADGRYVDLNEAFERQMGYGRAEVLGRTSLELNVWPTPAHRIAMTEALLRQKTIRHQNIEFRTKSGQRDHHRLLGRPRDARRTAMRAGRDPGRHRSKDGGRCASGERGEISAAR